MSYEVGKKEKSQIKISFTIAKDEWQEAINEAYKKNKKNYKLEGFRKGNVPKSLLEKTYGQQIFFEDAFNIVLEKSYYEAIEKENIIPVARPEIALGSMTGEGVSYTAVVTVKPDVELPKEAPKVELPKLKKITEKDIEEELKRYQEKATAFVEVTDRACKKGDTVEIDYSGSVDGVKFDGGTAEKQPLELGSGQFIPGFEDQVEGMKIGEEKVIKVTFPKEYNAELAGKDAEFAIKLHAIKYKEVPEINDELVKDVSEFNTVSELKEDIKKHLEMHAKEDQEKQFDNAIVEAYVKASKFEIPKIMIDEQVEQDLDQFEQQLKMQGFKAEDYYKYTNMTREQIKEQYRDNSKKKLESILVVGALIDSLNIKVEKEDIEKRLNELAAQYNIEKSQFEQMMANASQYVEQELVTMKLFEELRKKVK